MRLERLGVEDAVHAVAAQMGPFGRERARVHVRVNLYICFRAAYLNGSNAKETLL